MAGSTAVTRLRVSHVGARIHDGLREIGGPVAFAERLAGLQPVRGLPVTLPYGDGLPVDTGFWSRIAERQLTVPVPLDTAPKLRRALVPLRYRGTLAVDAEVPRLEAHLHPFGVVAMTTVDLCWPEAVPLEQVWQPVNQLDGEPATITAGGAQRSAPLGQAAVAAAQALVELLTDAGHGEPVDLEPYRLATVIDGALDQPPTTMPAANSPLHLALHHLSGGGDVVAEPATAFVAQWSGAGYAWPPNRLMYMLDRGTSLLTATASTGQEPSTADRHRHLLLLVAYLTAAAGLVRAAQTSQSILFPEWARTAAQRLGLLFGPGQAFRDWGVVPRALLQRTGAIDAVGQVLGAPLTPNPNYPVAPYN